MLKYKKRVPYSTTEVSPERSRAQIEKMLYEYGAEGVNITTKADGTGVLRFLMEIPKEGGQTKKLMVEITPPILSKRVKVWDDKLSRTVERDVIHTGAAWRLTFYYLKAKLESIVSGLVDFEHEFLADTVIQDDMGRQVTVAKVLIPLLEKTGGQLSLPSGDRKEERSTVVEAELVR